VKLGCPHSPHHRDHQQYCCVECHDLCTTTSHATIWCTLPRYSSKLNFVFLDVHRASPDACNGNGTVHLIVPQKGSSVVVVVPTKRHTPVHPPTIHIQKTKTSHACAPPYPIPPYSGSFGSTMRRSMDRTYHHGCPSYPSSLEIMSTHVVRH
jgi:hypothetical protein